MRSSPAKSGGKVVTVSLLLLAIYIRGDNRRLLAIGRANGRGRSGTAGEREDDIGLGDASNEVAIAGIGHNRKTFAFMLNEMFHGFGQGCFRSNNREPIVDEIARDDQPGEFWRVEIILDVVQ